MVRAYVAIIVGEGAAEDDAVAIRDLPGVTEAHVVAGDFDVIAEVSHSDTSCSHFHSVKSGTAEVEGETVRDLQRVVTGGIHEVDGVGTTRTYVQLD